MLYNHRLKLPLEKALNQGKRVLFFYGSGIKDYYLEGILEGNYTLQEVFQHYFLDNKEQDSYQCRYYTVISTNGVHIYKKEEEQILEVSEDFLAPKKVEDDMPEDEEEGETEQNSRRKESREAQNLQESIQNSGVNIVNYVNIIKSRIGENQDSQQRYAVFFEDFEWLANLYSSSNDTSLEYIKILKDFMLLENCYVLVSLEEIELLKKYNFETKGSNVIFLGNPSAKEIKYAFFRRFLQKTTFYGEIQENLFEELEETGQAISSSKKSLREALDVLDALVIDPQKERIERTDFEVAIEKITAEKVLLEDVIIEEAEKRRILHAVESFIESDDAREYRKGFILTGPPGTGKTQVVRALANEKNCYFMAPTLSDLKGEYVGQTSSKVKRIFDEAKANAPTIMFIDEADTVFPSRDIGSGNSDSFNLDMVNQFLQEIDGMTSGKEKIFVIAATNRPNIIDPAIQSRLSERIEIGLPSAPNRIKIFDSKLKKYNFSLADKSYRNEIESKTINMSGRDIDNFVKKLKEHLLDTPFRTISNLQDNEESKREFLKVLEQNEQVLVEDLRRSHVEVLEPDEISTRYKDIIGYDRIKERISRQGSYICSSEAEKRKADTFGISVNKGVLLYGPPGNAKTKLAEATAKEHNFYFIKVLSKDFASDFVEKQLDNLEMIFNQSIRLSKMCNKYNGVLLFFDEFDSLAGIGNLNQVVRGTLLDYLAAGEKEERTGIRSPQSRILLMAATNFLWTLDDAVTRRGRIDEHLEMGDPSEEAGIEMLKRKFQEDVSLELKPSSLVRDIYENLRDKKQQEKEQKNKNVTEEQQEEIRPSGSDLINIFQEIKAEAYYRQKDELKDNGKLQITEELISDYFAKK